MYMHVALVISFYVSKEMAVILRSVYMRFVDALFGTCDVSVSFFVAFL